MTKRLLTRTLMRLALAAIVMAAVTARAAEFTPGVHYFTLKEPQAVQTGSQVEVLELFWYGCPHCYDLEPYLEKWVKTKSENAEYVRLPAVLRRSWALHARAFYTFEALNVLDKLHRDFFDEIHKRKNRIQNTEQLESFVVQRGIDKEQFYEAYNSFAVDSKLRNAQLMSARYEANGVPAIVVDGKYRATASSAGGFQELMQLVNHLVEKAAAER
ncbi:MAG: thiol:disulfide interchange protein DsbA/DsbL [Gammaproteobacteria bacterium]|nr:thiol:disulfide interchange protein DsbA/DsbL [Gammaproteobacteria bacterium]